MAETYIVGSEKLPVTMIAKDKATNKDILMSAMHDPEGSGVLRTVDAAPVSYDPITDTTKVQLIKGSDDLGIQDLIKNANSYYLNQRVSKGITSNFEEILNTPSNVGEHAAMVYGGKNHIYAVLGSYVNTFRRYSIKDDTWQNLADLPETTFGIALVYTGEHIYATKGQGSKKFWRYSIKENKWDVMAEPPSNFGYGGASLVYTGGEVIYALAGNGSEKAFMSYNITNNTWSTLANIPEAVRTGSSLISADNPNVIYAVIGSASTFNNKKLFKYTISDNTWSELAPMPDIASGSLAYTGGDYIFATRGMGSRQLWRYSISQNTWENMIQAPSPIIGGGNQLVYAGDGYLYAFKGNGFTTFWRIPFGFSKWQPWMK